MFFGLFYYDYFVIRRLIYRCRLSTNFVKKKFTSKVNKSKLGEKKKVKLSHYENSLIFLK